MEFIKTLIKSHIKGMTVSIGIGNAYNNLSMMKNSLKESEWALNTIKLKGLKDEIIRYKDIGVYSLLFNINNKKHYPVKEDRIAMNAKQILFPTFGMDDIYISAEVSSLRNRMASYEDRKSFEINNGKMLFDVKDIEVFHVIDTYTWKE